MPVEASRTLWNQFILACALDRCARGLRHDPHGEAPGFCYTDTHAGSGRLGGPLPLAERLLAQRGKFTLQIYFDALDRDPPGTAHPGSWLMAGRVLGRFDLALEIDVNDIDPEALAQARQNREGAWTRYWSHDWFLFLRSRLAMAGKPSFVFIDPPPDDARGCAYGIDAAILLDTLGVPYVLSYPAENSQDSIDQIGRTGLELVTPSLTTGVLLGGGAETALLELLPDLRRLAEILGGELVTRLPGVIDYTI